MSSAIACMAIFEAQAQDMFVALYDQSTNLI